MGDEAMVLSVVRAIRRRVPDATITLLSAEPVPDHLLQDVDRRLPSAYAAFRRRQLWQRVLGRVHPHLADELSLRTIVRSPRSPAVHRLVGLPEEFIASAEALRNAHAVVDVGGANINSIWPSSFYDKLAVSALAGPRTRLFHTGQAIEPLATLTQQRRLKNLVGRASGFWVRESASLGVAQRAGVPAGRVSLGVDDAFALRPPRRARVRGSFSKIAFQYRAYLEYGAEEAIAEAASHLDALHRETGAALVGVAMHYGHRDERADLARVRSAMRFPEALSIGPKEHDPDSVLDVLSEVDASVGMSHHFAVLSILAQCPTVSLVRGRHYTHKSIGMREQFSCSATYLPLGSSTTQLLAELDRLREVEVLDAAIIERRGAIATAETTFDEIAAHITGPFDSEST